jgi:hypothetical protein
MAWRPITLEDLRGRIRSGLSHADDELRSFYERVACEPTKWRQHPWGDPGGGFWIVAVHEDRVLWFNDIEEGFNVSRFEAAGRIPGDEYWCNQDELHRALRNLRDGDGVRLGPPRPIEPA